MALKEKTRVYSEMGLSLVTILVLIFFVFKPVPKVESNTAKVDAPKVVEEEPVLNIFVVDETKNLDLLGKASLSYDGGTEGRHKNIELGIARINGTTIAPGDEFSFIKTIGEVTVEDGFSEEKVFLNGEVTKGLGGGLCQLSSTLFQTAINTGLPVTERQNHSYSVSYYDVGMDATYTSSGPDLKFKNDTENPIVIKGRTEDKKVVFEIYGISDGRIASTTEVEISKIVDIPPTKYVYKPMLEEGEQKCINSPQIGYTAEIKYNILYPTGEYKEQIFRSKYNPLQKICYVVGDELANFGKTVKI